jgi:hypothetical protein
VPRQARFPPLAAIPRGSRVNRREGSLADSWVRGDDALVSITPDILAQLRLSDMDAVVFYKRDEITTDLICCDVEAAGRVWTFHEEAAGWKDLIAHLASLPGFRTDWYAEVVNPPFATNETVAYQSR